MSRARIVLETTDARKSAMVEAASLQGATLTDWFEEQVASTLPLVSRAAPEHLDRAHWCRGTRGFRRDL